MPRDAEGDAKAGGGGAERRAFDLFALVCDLPREERGAVLDRECAGDARLRAAVESLLAHDAQVDDRLDQPVMATAREERRHASGGDLVQIGRYRIIRRLGVGGMGVVYEAEQDSPRRRVAVKVMHSFLLSPERLEERFVREGQIQAKLSHPFIAQIHETGVAAADDGSGVGSSGTPYMVMELVDGTPLGSYLKGCSLSASSRVRLFLDICEAVGFAHQRGVIHRDLKPANIMVCETTTGLRPKVLDFGVAKLTTHEQSLVSMHTNAGQLIGTLAYMSPEQARGSSDDVDTRTDIYALGLSLFEMLSGSLPLRIENVPLHEAARRIAEDPPTRLGTILPTARGDLETIVHKAIDKEKSRRYDSVTEFAADLRRFLSDTPILARPPSAAYTLSKFARRHRVVFGAIASVFIILIAAVIFTTLTALAADRARARAEQKTAVAEGVSAALLQALTTATPKGSLGKEPLVIEAVNRIEKDADTGESSPIMANPEVRAVVYNIAGIIHRERGDLARAEAVFLKALEIRRSVLDPSDPNLADSINNMGLLRRRQGRPAEAAIFYEQAVTLQRTAAFRDDVRLARNLYNLASAYTAAGLPAKAAPIAQESLAMHRAMPNPSRELLAMHSSLLARIAMADDRWADASRLAGQALEEQRAANGLEHPTIALCLVDVAQVLLHEGEFARAESVLREAEAMAVKLFPTQSHTTIRAIRTALVKALRGVGKIDQAQAVEAMLEQPG
jgi:tetratricopeptide (TPR) repeat protein